MPASLSKIGGEQGVAPLSRPMRSFDYLTILGVPIIPPRTGEKQYSLRKYKARADFGEPQEF